MIKKIAKFPESEIKIISQFAIFKKIDFQLGVVCFLINAIVDYRSALLHSTN